ncbi:MAG: hypothetical protein ABJC12_01220 [Saprospiraceae bacterium]
MSLSSFLPYENYILTTALPAAEVNKRLADNIEPKSNSPFTFGGRVSVKPYEGKIENGEFTINRIINYRNSFLPVINGVIASTPRGTTIFVKMRLVIIVLIFIIFWLGMVGFAGTGLLLAGIFKIQSDPPVNFLPYSFIPLGMFFMGVFMTSYAFKRESKKAKIFLEELLEGVEE